MTNVEEKIGFFLENGDYYDTDNNFMLLLVPELLEDNIKKIVKFSFLFGERYQNISIIPNGMYLVKKNDKDGIVDKAGRKVIDCSYDCILDFCEGIVIVKKNWKYGCVNEEGKK